jgi:hypothetical protein
MEKQYFQNYLEYKNRSTEDALRKQQGPILLEQCLGLK